MREFRDPIHGFIELEDDEAEIVDSAPFQRLRHVSQLALTSYVYHGAEHTRFGHSLGTMHLATLAFDRLAERHRDDLHWNQDDRMRKRKIVRLAALLHDTGHAPFSHAGERKLFSQPDRHDHYSREVARAEPVAQIISRRNRELGLTADDVASLLDPEAVIADQFLRELISGELGVDRMDYLTRDSLYCGVKYGVFDFTRLIHTLILKEEEGGGFVLAVDEGGLHAAEGLLLARYSMFTQVYFHHVRRVYDLHLADVIGEALSIRFHSDTYPVDVGDYLSLDDRTIWRYMMDAAPLGSSQAASRILGRTHYARVFDTGLFPAPRLTFRFKELAEEVRSRFGVAILTDAAEDHPEKYRQADIYVRLHAPARWVLLAAESAALAGLKTIFQIRMYADARGNDALKNQMTDFCKAWEA